MGSRRDRHIVVASALCAAFLCYALLTLQSHLSSSLQRADMLRFAAEAAAPSPCPVILARAADELAAPAGGAALLSGTLHIAAEAALPSPCPLASARAADELAAPAGSAVLLAAAARRDYARLVAPFVFPQLYACVRAPADLSQTAAEFASQSREDEWLWDKIFSDPSLVAPEDTWGGTFIELGAVECVFA
jgi:hypothetical protein